MRSVSGDSNAVLPWLVIRQDGQGNRYRVGSYATRAEAQLLAERLGREGAGAGHGADGYLVEHLDRVR
ncbi:SPOR domain-containing protein [Streptomyces iconiensis]|uniref:SPOR domain-containing protein n=1 Tax=Streptomyces iconiensis TaxID=1384038 RepID=A0ABT7A033_9ACTN|nr:SPOR domain-containing protein [Streptomyces iconiensis]MDJ1134691.1 SPOR domain-containing protein [Streptomyces iconiensis]